MPQYYAQYHRCHHRDAFEVHQLHIGIFHFQVTDADLVTGCKCCLQTRQGPYQMQSKVLCAHLPQAHKVATCHMAEPVIRAHNCMRPTATAVALIVAVLSLPNSPLGCAMRSTPTRHMGTQIQSSLQSRKDKHGSQQLTVVGTSILIVKFAARS